MGSQVAGVGGEEVLGEAGHVRAHDDEIGANLMRLAPQPLVEVDGRIGAGDGMGAKLGTMLGALRGREPGQLVREFLRDRKSTRLNSSHSCANRMPSSS